MPNNDDSYCYHGKMAFVAQIITAADNLSFAF
ncbi:Uncharacterised protein [Shewanella putrefaciens]|nr:hypothetical protein [Shewanella putrefaciens]CAD6365733.1 hypothetical protein SHEWT2_03620 [Shewanella hafniensis]SUI77886.1 Uncharacterised protein [Shewanella putrefaciens]